MKRVHAEISSISFFAPQVIVQRMSRIMLPDAMRTKADRAEDTRMVAEKVKAAGDGLVAMQTEMASQMMNAWNGMAFGKMPNAARATDAVVAAGLKPARRKVKANAKRLGKRK
jgi:hypothetical protein